MATLWILLALAALVLIAIGVRAVTVRQAFITFEDALGAPGTEAELLVEVERCLIPFVDPGVRVPVRLALNGADLPEQTTVRGVARWKIPVEEPGARPARASLGETRCVAPDAEATLFAVDPERPIFVCDIDRTISDARTLHYVLRSNERIPPIAGARDALHRLSERFQILYLTARDHIFLRKTREWLRLHDFPPAPVILRRLRIWSASLRAHKEGRLREILAPFTGPRIGVGDRLGDARAYLAVSATPILFRRGPSGDLPKDTAHADTWEEVERLALASLRQEAV